MNVLLVVLSAFTGFCAYRFGRGFVRRWRELYNDGLVGRSGAADKHDIGDQSDGGESGE